MDNDYLEKFYTCYINSDSIKIYKFNEFDTETMHQCSQLFVACFDGVWHKYYFDFTNSMNISHYSDRYNNGDEECLIKVLNVFLKKSCAHYKLTE